MELAAKSELGQHEAFYLCMFKNSTAKYVPNKLASKDKFHLTFEIWQTFLQLLYLVNLSSFKR